MNHTLKTRSLLVREAERNLRRERSQEASAKIFAVCLFVIVAYLLVAFVQGVIS